MASCGLRQNMLPNHSTPKGPPPDATIRERTITHAAASWFVSIAQVLGPLAVLSFRSRPWLSPRSVTSVPKDCGKLWAAAMKLSLGARPVLPEDFLPPFHKLGSEMSGDSEASGFGRRIRAEGAVVIAADRPVVIDEGERAAADEARHGLGGSRDFEMHVLG
jgi:hypothetical protein